MLGDLARKIKEALRIIWYVLNRTSMQMLEENRKLRRELRALEQEIGIQSGSAVSLDDVKNLTRDLARLASLPEDEQKRELAALQRKRYRLLVEDETSETKRYIH